LEALMIDRGPTFLRCGALALALCVPALAAAGSAFEAGIGAGTSWYDHRSGADGPTTYTLRSIKPYVRYDAGRESPWGLRVLAQRRFEMYSGSAIDSVLGTGRHTHDRMSLRAERRLSAFERIGLDAGYVRSHDLLEADQGTVVVDGNVTRWSGGVDARVSLLELVAKGRTTSYDDRPQYIPSAATSFSARLIPIRRPAHAVFVGGAVSRLELDEATALWSRSASAGYRRHVSPLVALELEAGAIETQFEDGAVQRRPMFAVGVERDPDRGSALGFALRARAEGDSLASVSAEARWRLASGRVWLRGESLADAEGGLYRHATRTRRIAAGIEDTLGRANVVGVEASYIRTRALRGEEDGTEVLRSSGWVMRRVQPWLNARLGASYLREPIGVPTSGPIYRRIRLDAELIVLHGSFGTSSFKGPTGNRSGRAS
jgi:hypothetical protein